MSVLRGFGLSLKLDFIHDRFLHSPSTPSKKNTQPYDESPFLPIFYLHGVYPYSTGEEVAQTLGSCLQFFAFQP